MEYLYKITGYRESIGTNLQDYVTIWASAENSGKALDKAKVMIKKKHYRISEVHEKINNTALEEYNLQNLLFQKYRKKIDAEVLKNNREANKHLDIQNGYLEEIVKILERTS